jgi:hypothetical protein
MRSADNVLWLVEDRRHGPTASTTHAPKSFSTKPVAIAPHPALISGGWYNSAAQEVVGPGRYPVPRPPDRTARAALRWTFFLGPLGLCYLSTTAGLLATALTAGLLVLTGSAVVLAVIWPVVMLLSVITATDRATSRR